MFPTRNRTSFMSFMLTAGALLITPASGAGGHAYSQRLGDFPATMRYDATLPLVLILVGIVALIVAAVLWTANSRRRTGSGSESECSEDPERDSSAPCERYRRAMADTRTEVVNTADGVMVRFTGGHPDIVRLLQDYWNEYGKLHALGSPYPPDPAPARET